MFENKKFYDIHATRYIVSWVKMGGMLRYGEDIDDFHNWLLSLGLTEDEANYIELLATNGKMELEVSAKKFLAERH